MTTPQPPEPLPPAIVSPPEAEPPVARDGGTRPLVISGGVGVLVGALIVGILWAASSFVGGGGSPAADDALAACGVFERVPDDWKPETVTEANTYQLGGAIALAQAAGKQDQEYVTLATQAQQVQQAVVSYDLGRVAQLVVDVRNTCHEL